MGYKLYYFNFRGAGEPLRFLFSFANVDFEDVRFEEEGWPPLKETMPFGMVPVVEFDGVRYGHSYALLNYLGKKLNLSGSNDLEDLQLNGIGLTIYDLVQSVEDISYDYKESLGDNFPTEFQKILNEKFPYIFGKFEAIVAKNGGTFLKEKLHGLTFFLHVKLSSSTHC